MTINETKTSMTLKTGIVREHFRHNNEHCYWHIMLMTSTIDKSLLALAERAKRTLFLKPVSHTRVSWFSQSPHEQSGCNDKS